MEKNRKDNRVVALYRSWRTLDKSFRIAVWLGILMIGGIIILSNYIEPLASDTEFVTENDPNEETLNDPNNEDLHAHMDSANPMAEVIEPLQMHEFAVKVQKGDTLSDIFTRHEINVNDLYAILALPEAKKILTNLKLGQEIYIQLDRGHNLVKLTTQIALDKTLRITRPAPEFQVKIEQQTAETRLMRATGTVQTSLYRATSQVNIPRKVALQLAQVFSAKVNFGRDIQPGDTFKIVYQKKVINDTTVGVGDIVAAEVTVKNKTYTAIRYQAPQSSARYYSPDGHSLQRAFIRKPVKYSRISSSFNPNRMHPILNLKRPHYGTDFAAPAGTPVRAASDGKIIFAGKKGGYGNMIIINHGNQVTTRYGHLKKFAKNIRSGTRIEKGDTIGYVGSTGLATGPHLHYEYRIRGKAYNPMKVSLPTAHRVTDAQMSQFKATAAPLLTQLQTGNAKTQLAENKQQIEVTA